MEETNWLYMLVVPHWPEYMAFITIVNISNIEAVACVRKYLVAASVDRGLAFFMRIGTMANILISNPIHIKSQWELIIVSVVPVKIVSIINIRMMGFISTGRV